MNNGWWKDKQLHQLRVHVKVLRIRRVIRFLSSKQWINEQIAAEPSEVDTTNLVQLIRSGTEMAQLVCGGCRTLLMYVRGATSVQCSQCNTVNLSVQGEAQLKAQESNPQYCCRILTSSPRTMEIQRYLCWMLTKSDFIRCFPLHCRHTQ